jgi:predicted hydrolase (HD superfamily)
MVLSICIVYVARPGAFAANFRPDVLDRFRDLCRRQGKQYTKVLERLAEAYLDTEGAVLGVAVSAAPVDPDKKKRLVRVETLQNKLLEDLLKRVEVLERQKVKADYEIERVQKSVAFLQSGLQEPGSRS